MCLNLIAILFGIILLLELKCFECIVKNSEVDDRLLFQNHKTNSQVFVFSTNSSNWRYYDWSKITTIVEFGYHDDAMVDFAHMRGVLVSYAANFNKRILYDTGAIDVWTSEQTDFMMKNDLDGINIDFEDEINCTDIEARNNFVILMRLLRIKIKDYKSYAQLSIDVAWSPSNIDKRCYDYLALSEPSDLVFIMAYDERSQIVGPCIAWANSPYYDTVKGVKAYHELGIPLDKMILGVPWYGYDYECVSYHNKSDTCWIREVPFRGVPCSDAAGIQVGYSDIMIMLNSSIRGSIKRHLGGGGGDNDGGDDDGGGGDDDGGEDDEDELQGSKKNDRRIKVVSRNWDVESVTPYFTYLDIDTKVHHQVWYDNFISLNIKYSFAQSYGIAGVGFWNADSVKYEGDEVGRLAGMEMWEALPGERNLKNRL